MIDFKAIKNQFIWHIELITLMTHHTIDKIVWTKNYTELRSGHLLAKLIWLFEAKEPSPTPKHSIFDSSSSSSKRLEFTIEGFLTVLEKIFTEGSSKGKYMN